eukprot:g992.t1
MPGVPRDLYNTEEFERCWPFWQNEAAECKNLVHVEIPCSLDRLMECLFHTQSAFQKKAQDARHYTDVQESPWVDSVSELPALPASFTWSDLTNDSKTGSNPIPGRVRKLLFTCPGNALHPSSFRTEQVERCRSFTSGKQFIFEVCVLSSPMYCDRFRPIVKYTATSMTPNRCCLSVDYQIMYISKVNFVLRRFIEGSARSGMEDSFQKWLVALMEFFQPTEVVDLKLVKSKGKQKQQDNGVKQKDLKSHKLDDITEEYMDNEDFDQPSGSSDLTLLTIVLLVVRFIVAILAFMHWFVDKVTYLPRKLVFSVSWSIVISWVLTGLVALCSYLIISQQLLSIIGGVDGVCTNQTSLLICFTVSIMTGVLTQCAPNLNWTI